MFFLILEIYLPSWIEEVYEIPKSIDFLRNNVSKNLPLIIRAGANSWPCIQKWDSKVRKKRIETLN